VSIPLFGMLTALRRELYGKAGAFRPKPYGVEYRVLSNRWLNSEALIRWVYNQSQLGMARRGLEDNNWAEDVWGDTAQEDHRLQFDQLA
jgi:hypothetical protein